MSRKGQSITLSVSAKDKAALEALALAFGMTWGDRPNISKLVEAIARQELRIAPNNDWPPDYIATLLAAKAALIDAGQIDHALLLSKILLGRSELSQPIRHELEQFITQPAPPWRTTLDRYIRQQRPFQLTYQDAAENLFEFRIHYATIANHGSRQYLDCWCESPEGGNKDLPELAHNRCLRLDRITDAAIHPIPGPWRNGLDTIQVEFYLYGGLAFAYESKTSPNDTDEINEWLTDPPQTRRIVRRTASTFWLKRDLLRYGQDCEVKSPHHFRQQLRAEIQAIAQRYSLP